MWYDEAIEKAAEIIRRINDENDAQWMIITIDSDSDDSTTPQRDEIFGKHNFFREYNGIPLPESTYLGKVLLQDAGESMIEEIWQELTNANLAPRRICGGSINDALIIRSSDDPN